MSVDPQIAIRSRRAEPARLLLLVLLHSFGLEPLARNGPLTAFWAQEIVPRGLSLAAVPSTNGLEGQLDSSVRPALDSTD